MPERQYELVYIIAPAATDEQVSEVHAQVEAVVTRFEGKLEKTENWGRRKLAYEIGHNKEGIYVLEYLVGRGDMIAELERRLRVSDLVIRHLVVRVDEELRVAQRAGSRRRARQERRRKAKGLPAEGAAPAAVPAEGAAATVPAEGAAPATAPAVEGASAETTPTEAPATPEPAGGSHE